MITKKLFLLFGSNAVTRFHEEPTNYEAIKQAIENNEGIAVMFPAGTNPLSLLDQFDGWLDFAEITCQDFNQITGAMEQDENMFPSGFDSYHETHFEIVSAIQHALSMDGPEDSFIRDVSETQGTGGLYELAQEMTNTFEQKHAGANWGEDVVYVDEIEKFIEEFEASKKLE